MCIYLSCQLKRIGVDLFESEFEYAPVYAPVQLHGVSQRGKPVKYNLYSPEPS